MNLPANLKYKESHEWVRTEADGTVTVGITDYAQEALGDIVFVELPKIGQALAAGTECAVVESVKAASDIYAPIGGVVLAVNESLAEAPEQINANAFEAWLFTLQPADPSELDGLLDAAGYQKNIGA